MSEKRESSANRLNRVLETEIMEFYGGLMVDHATEEAALTQGEPAEPAGTFFDYVLEDYWANYVP